MRSSVRKIGNSAGLILPRPVLDGLGVEVGDPLEITLNGDEVIVKASKRKVREGWEEAAKKIAAHGLSEEEVEWLEAPLTAETDEDWTW
ncbi:MAG: AbrB/MazE/SpoVT family DNA-binding domain-containing protein [Pseudomonadota bacterium]|jgi:antitoxin MazE|uniref:AbrB/MazE/SpoVT family DNA-binding domain-containing protein n=1 Tax=Caulobacter sp. CCH9-E1 TaxID=1768768 RepID=UPI000833A644|nr:AbrB/MazE/SpoVT family DNA-binding domain-containing protein [Caulobacter sp. CCH9-E1]